ncbi:MAG: hypothetical protein II968_06455 [Selenomonadaceae bacterium]|nr:hypothetical protein [Selenomonadaceae bacterium]
MTIISGGGNDLFVYKGGKDIITNYNSGDRISLAGTGASVLSDISGVSFSKTGAAILTFDANNKLTLNYASNLPIVINGATRLLEKISSPRPTANPPH